jgi:hypothetical protein
VKSDFLMILGFKEYFFYWENGFTHRFENNSNSPTIGNNMQ